MHENMKVKRVSRQSCVSHCAHSSYSESDSSSAGLVLDHVSSVPSSHILLLFSLADWTGFVLWPCVCPANGSCAVRLDPSPDYIYEQHLIWMQLCFQTSIRDSNRCGSDRFPAVYWRSASVHILKISSKTFICPFICTGYFFALVLHVQYAYPCGRLYPTMQCMHSTWPGSHFNRSLFYWTAKSYFYTK